MRVRHIITKITIVFIIGLSISCNLNPAVEDPEPIIVNFPDPNFEELIREILEMPNRNITNQDMWSIKEIIGVGRDIFNISGIEYCTGVNTVHLRDNFISNIEPMSELVLLEYINLQDNQVVDILPLINNVGLGIGNDIIIIYNNPLSDESILTYKPQLQSRGVMFYSNAELSIPGEINFMDDNFEMVIREYLNKPTGAILSTDLESITNIYAQNRNISNIYGIEFCKYINTLDISENQISDIIPLHHLRDINSLNLNNNKITIIGSIRYLYDLTELTISNNIISNISSISNLTNLRYLNISNNPIVDIEPIGNLDSLIILGLMDLNLFDFYFIRNIANLQTLYLSNTQIINLDLISNITSLKNLIAKNCNITNIESFVNLNKLGKLILTDNNITDITSLSELYELWELHLDNNDISDILPLVINFGIGENEYVLLYNNPLSETSINTYIPQLEDRGVRVFY